MKPKSKEQLVRKKPKTAGYKSTPYHWGWQVRDLPPFSHLIAQAMLMDPTVRLGLAMRAAPLCQAEFAYKEGEDWKPGIESSDPMVSAFVERNMKRIWANDLKGLLESQKWGWAAAEVVYKQTSGSTVEVAGLLHRQAYDSRVITQGGSPAGVRFLNVKGADHDRVDTCFPYCLWHAFRPEAGEFYGTPILKGAYSPWWDKWMDGGALDVRRLFMHKDAYGGVDVSYPDGYTEIERGGTVVSVPNRDIAREMAEQIKAGGVTTRPSDIDPTSSKEKWTITRASVPANPAHILQYPKDLDTEILRGLEIPDDVLESTEGAGGAWAGKTVPQGAFYTGLELWLRDLIVCIKTQIMDHLVRLNFGRNVWYEITTKPLSLQATEQQGKDKAPEAAPQPNPFAMSLEAIGRGAIGAEPFVRAAKRTRRVRMGASPKGSNGARWVTIGGRKKGDDNHAGGFPVQIDKDGNILKGGPKGLQGKHVSDIGKHFKETREARKSEADDFFGNIVKERETAAKADHAERGAGNTRSLKKIVAYQAEKWGMDEATYQQFMDEIEQSQIEFAKQREAFKRHAREQTNLTAGRLKAIEERGGKGGRGGDSDSIKNLDTTAEILAANYPQFFTGRGDPAEELFAMLREGVQEPPSRISREFHDKIDEYLEEQMAAAGSNWQPDDAEESLEELSDDPNVMPFGLRRMSKDAGGREHKGKGPGGGQFTAGSGGGGSGDDEPFQLNSKPKQNRTLDIPFPSKAKQKDLFAGRGDAPGQTSFFDDIDPKAKNVADQGKPKPEPPPVFQHPSTVSEQELFKRSGSQFEELQKSLGITNLKMGPAGVAAINKALSSRPGGAVIASLLQTNSQHFDSPEDFKQHGFPSATEAMRAQIDGKFTREQLLDASRWTASHPDTEINRFVRDNIRGAKATDGEVSADDHARAWQAGSIDRLSKAHGKTAAKEMRGEANKVMKKQKARVANV